MKLSAPQRLVPHPADLSGDGDHSQPQELVRTSVSTVFDVVTQQRLGTVLTLESSAQGGAESLGLTAFTSQGVRDLCLTVTALMSEADEKRSVTILLSAATLLSESFVMNLKSCLLAAGVLPSALTLSLPEGDLLNASQRVRSKLDVLSTWGVRLAIHDFGVRIAPLAVLEDFPVDAIYLHETLAKRITNILRAPHYPVALIRALVETATYLEFDVVASGVASLEAMKLLHSLGCVQQRGPFLEAALAAKQEGPGNFHFGSGESTSAKN